MHCISTNLEPQCSTWFLNRKLYFHEHILYDPQSSRQKVIMSQAYLSTVKNSLIIESGRLDCSYLNALFFANNWSIAYFACAGFFSWKFVHHMEHIYWTKKLCYIFNFGFRITADVICYSFTGRLPFPELLQQKVERSSVLPPVHPGGYPGGIPTIVYLQFIRMGYPKGIPIIVYHQFDGLKVHSGNGPFCALYYRWAAELLQRAVPHLLRKN